MADFNAQAIDNAIHAIRSNNSNYLKSALNEGLNPDSIGSNGNSLLFEAAYAKKPQMVIDLLSSGANPNLPCEGKNTITFNSLFEPTTENSRNLAIQNMTPVMAALIENPRSTATGNKLASKIEDTIAVIELLNSFGANISYSEKNTGITPIILAANTARPEILNHLINMGADVNSCSKLIFNFYKDIEVTPIIAACGNVFDINSPKLINDQSRCMQILLKKGADLSKFFDDGVIMRAIMECAYYGDREQKKAAFDNYITNLFEEESDTNFEKILNGFMSRKIDPYHDLYINQTVSKMLGLTPNSIRNDYNSISKNIKYFSHLRSFEGELLYAENDSIKKIEAAGWFPTELVPLRIKNLLKLAQSLKFEPSSRIEEISNNKYDTLKNILQEVKSQYEIYKSAVMIEFLQMPSLCIQTDNPYGKFKPLPDSLENERLIDIIANIWSNKIAKLEPGNSFSVFSGFPKHAIYMEYKKDTDGSISRTIFNLGGGSLIHKKDKNGRTFPHTIEKIDCKAFEEHSRKAIDFIKAGIVSTISELGPEILYNRNKFIGLRKDYNHQNAMKMQLAGNCTLKNNSAKMIESIGKDILKYLKSQEEESILKSFNIPETLIERKETCREIFSLIFIIDTFKENMNLDALEYNLYQFLKKRSNPIPSEIENTPGDRVAYALQNAKKAEKIQFFFSNIWFFPLLLNLTEKHCKSEQLKNYLNEKGFLFEKALTIQSLPKTINNCIPGFLSQSKNTRAPRTPDDASLEIESQIFVKSKRALNNDCKALSDNINMNKMGAYELESHIFKTLKKYSREIPKNIATNKNLRLSFVLDNVRDDSIIHYFLIKNPYLLEDFEKIARYFNSKELKNCSRRFQQPYIISPNSFSKSTPNGLMNIFPQFLNPSNKNKALEHHKSNPKATTKSIRPKLQLQNRDSKKSLFDNKCVPTRI